MRRSISLFISVSLILSYGQDTTISFRCFIFRERFSKSALVILFLETENTQRKIFSNGYSTQTISDFSMGNLSTIEIFILLIYPHYCLAGFPASSTEPNPGHMSSRSEG